MYSTHICIVIEKNAAHKSIHSRQLKMTGLYDYTNIILTSDHGMAPLSPERLVLLDPDDNNDIRRNVILRAV